MAGKWAVTKVDWSVDLLVMQMVGKTDGYSAVRKVARRVVRRVEKLVEMKVDQKASMRAGCSAGTKVERLGPKRVVKKAVR